MPSILDFRGLYFCAAYLPANNLRRISTTYSRGYWEGSENGQVAMIGIDLHPIKPLSTEQELTPPPLPHPH